MASAADKNATKKTKLVRDSFTIPKNEFNAIEALKTRAIALGTSVKKSELLRAGLMVLQGLNDAAYKAAIAGVPTLKTGRPAGESAAAPTAAKPVAKAKAAPAGKAPAGKTPARKAAVKKAVAKKAATQTAPKAVVKKAAAKPAAKKAAPARPAAKKASVAKPVVEKPADDKAAVKA